MIFGFIISLFDFISMFCMLKYFGLGILLGLVDCLRSGHVDSVKRLIEHNDELVAIHPRLESLLVALRTATAEGGRLLKDKSSNHDILDAFRLSCQYYKLSV
jgi:hypothetical protein